MIHSLFERKATAVSMIGKIGAPGAMAVILCKRRRKDNRDNGMLTLDLNRDALLRAARLSAILVLSLVVLVKALNYLANRRNRWV